MPQDSMVGIILPASGGGALANIAVLLAGKIPGQPEFHCGARSDEYRDPAMRNQHYHYFPAIFVQGEP